MEETPRGTKRKSTHSSEKKTKKRSKHIQETQQEQNGENQTEKANTPVPHTNGTDSLSKPTKTKKSRKDKQAKSSSRETTTKNKSTPFTTIRASMFVTLPPILQANAHLAICANQLSPLLGLYYPEFHGTILAYTNLEFPGQSPSTSNSSSSEESSYILAQTISESALPQLWISADFLVFQPRVGSVIEGYVNVQEDGYLNLVVFNWFSAMVSKRRLPRDWVWVEDDDEEDNQDKATAEPATTSTSDPRSKKPRKKRRGEGHWENAEGVNVAELGAISFRVVNVTPPFVRDERDRQIMSIAGSLLSVEEEKELVEEVEERAQSISRRTASLVPVPRGILKNGGGGLGRS